MRESNFHFPSANKACVSITSALYDRRALDCTADLPLVNSLSHLNYLTSSSARIREILTTDGGLERLVRILRTTRVTDDTLHNWKWTMAFQCVVNVGVRGSAEIRQRVVQVGAVPILVEILHAYLLAADVQRLEHKVRDALTAQSERLPLAKMMDFAADPTMLNSDEHAEINDPSNTVVSSHILASGANNSTGLAPPRSSSAAAARSNAQAAAAAAVAAVTGVNPIPVAVPPMLSPTAAVGATGIRQQTRRVGEGVHPLARHVAYSDSVVGAAAAAAGPHAAIPSAYMPYSSHANSYYELERLQEEHDTARRRLQTINHVMYRHDDVVLTLQLLAYLSKTPSQRQLLHECPLLYTQMRAIHGAAPTSRSGSAAAGGAVGYATQNDLDGAYQAAQAAAQANAAAGIPPPRRCQTTSDATVDVFSIVEKFSVLKAFPSDMVHWSAIVMRNCCRRDETRNYCRQCAYSKCQKWELHPNEFAKCRRCRKAKYCSKVCQSSAWQEGHRYWCAERNPSSTGNPASMDGDAAVAAAAAAVTGSVVAMAGAMPIQHQQPPQPPASQQLAMPPPPQNQHHAFYTHAAIDTVASAASHTTPQLMPLPASGGSAEPSLEPFVPARNVDGSSALAPSLDAPSATAASMHSQFYDPQMNEPGMGAAASSGSLPAAAHRQPAGGPSPSALYGGASHHYHHHYHHHPYRSPQPEPQPPAPSGRGRGRGRPTDL
ncbi:hypothetical protein GGI04_000944 [Coemansia thaxteri]|uniref:MYND-type domain-containing protein n=1 Tax=Coemansia thaxteri TaxID=2663907 RepID=A0A9W8EGZ1_9FUNG|nr:hypothetical protein H4R26_001405 [Coemansia thaxteri]KAJ2008832.1 hypothetical protein GGI04_000944 [Coemansia thaxteri]KAJ2473098.1 hypothetical protein GGI02_001115 [Coemansia sp. RSA 2322]KAJ2487343.1 hypothetical protein EV174_000562 [Coemansia sp. RSA 2320]